MFSSPLKEAIISTAKGKPQEEYRKLMTKCFEEMYRVLQAWSLDHS